MLIIFSVTSNGIVNNITILPPPPNTNVQTQVDNIYKFLLAEIAIYRNNPEVAVSNLKLLLSTNHDPYIAEIITEYAIDLEHYDLSILSAKQWAELAPNNFKAQLVAATMLLEDDQALVEKFLIQATKIDSSQIINQISSLLPKLLDHHKQLILQIFKNLAIKDPNNPIIQLCVAQIAAQLNQIDLAVKTNNIALKLQPNLTHAIFLQAKLIRHNTKSDQSALNYLKQQLNIFSKDDELRLFYINVLLDNNQSTEALAQLKILLKSNIKNYKLEANLLIAEIYLQKPNLNLKQAKIYLNKLINKNFAPNKVAFLLGQIAEQEHDFQTAINNYTSITEEPYHIAAYIRAATLLANTKQFSQAIELLETAQPSNLLETKQLLLFKIELALYAKDLQVAFQAANSAISILPEDVDFLYIRSIVAGLNNQITTAEQDLKQILSLQPDNHSALNALGYLLASKTDRNKEALGYLQQALKLSPNNPIYLDSLGWLLYRMGKTSDSIEMLYKAYNIDNDAVIANHLGEALWKNGQQQQATSIWKKAWQADPNDIDLLNTLKQYKINFSNK